MWGKCIITVGVDIGGLCSFLTYLFEFNTEPYVKFVGF
jgi:hypothetical protein